MFTLPVHHAILIITHGNFQILEKQLEFFDSENIDFYIHIDAKAGKLDLDRFLRIPKRSSVHFIRRKSVEWGAYSMIQCEMDLLETASLGHYDYYHLISGVDVPVKSCSYFEEFFSRYNGTNYVHFVSSSIAPTYIDRVKYYYPFQSWRCLDRYKKIRFGRILINRVQKKLKIDRIRNSEGIEFQFGANWFSITDGLTRYVLSQKKLIKQLFRSTCCADELFLQTVVINSPFKDTLAPNAFSGEYKSCCRYIDWSRGNPYTFKNSDFDELIHTGPEFLFARKFDYSTDSEVVDKLFDYFGDSSRDNHYYFQSI